MTKDKLKIGTKIIVTKKPDRATNVEICDLAIECGFSYGEHQFHSTNLVDTGKKRGEYWVEFLPRDCYQIITVKGE